MQSSVCQGLGKPRLLPFLARLTASEVVVRCVLVVVVDKGEGFGVTPGGAWRLRRTCTVWAARGARARPARRSRCCARPTRRWRPTCAGSSAKQRHRRSRGPSLEPQWAPVRRPLSPPPEMDPGSTSRAFSWREPSASIWPDGAGVRLASGLHMLRVVSWRARQAMEGAVGSAGEPVERSARGHCHLCCLVNRPVEGVSLPGAHLAS